MTKSSRFANDLKTDFKVVTSMAETSRTRALSSSDKLESGSWYTRSFKYPYRKKSQKFKSEEYGSQSMPPFKVLFEIKCNDLIAKLFIEKRKDVPASMWTRPILLKPERGGCVQSTCRQYKSIF